MFFYFFSKSIVKVQLSYEWNDFLEELHFQITLPTSQSTSIPSFTSKPTDRASTTKEHTASHAITSNACKYIHVTVKQRFKKSLLSFYIPFTNCWEGQVYIKRGANENNHFESIRITDFLLGKIKKTFKEVRR